MFSTPTRRTGSDCDAGKYAANAGTEDCTACDDLEGLTSPSGASVCVCVVGKYRDDASGECVPCSDGMDCSEAGSSLAKLKLTAGSWRPSDTSSEVFVCTVAAACLGGGSNASINEESSRGCADGNEGPLCNICSTCSVGVSETKICRSV